MTISCLDLLCGVCVIVLVIFIIQQVRKDCLMHVKNCSYSGSTALFRLNLVNRNISGS